MSKVILQVMGDALGGRMPPVPTFIKSCDFDAHGGRGQVVFTQKKDEALRFDDKVAALEYWRTQSKVAPIRPDGKPNRPLTAYNVAFYEETMDPM